MQRSFYGLTERDLHWFIQPFTALPIINRINQTMQKAACISAVSHLALNAGFVRVWNGEQDLLRQAVAHQPKILELLTLNKCAPRRQKRCAAGEGGHEAGNSENCRTREIKGIKNDLLSFNPAQSVCGRTKPGSLSPQQLLCCCSSTEHVSTQFRIVTAMWNLSQKKWLNIATV